MNTSLERWNSIRKNIGNLQQKSLPVCLVAVSKAQPASAILPLLEAGQRIFAENRVQEAKTKWPELRVIYPEIELHLIGSLQTNKVKEALSLFDVIQTVDRVQLVDAILREWQPGVRCTRFFIQVNTGEEPQKNGVLPADLSALLGYCRAASLPVAGLMCVPPIDKPPEPYFSMLHARAREYNLSCLSMGMSGDYEIAIEQGATHVRIGTALFGERR